VKWYDEIMSGTYPIVMGDRGRLVVPAELRQRLKLKAGSPLVLLETPQGVVLATREQVKTLVRTGLQGLDLVGELLEDRRRQAAAEDAA
jgi:AbrB family looped-hinge helix DNA binding protein